MATIQFQVSDANAARGQMRVLCTEDLPEIDDMLEAIAALAAQVGVSFDSDGRTSIDPSRAQQVNPGGTLCRIVIDTRKRKTS